MKTGQHLDGDIELPFEGQGIAQRDHVRQIATLDQLHRDVELSLRFAEIVYRDDVGMLDRAGGARFAAEAFLHVHGLSKTAAQQAQRHLTAQNGVIGLPNDAHRSFPEELVQLVLAESLVTLLSVAHWVSQSYARVR